MNTAKHHQPAQILTLEFRCEASPILTARRIARAIATKINDGRSQHHTPEWLAPVDVTEGSERCGYGPLHVSGRMRMTDGSGRGEMVIENLGSEWRNYGAPTGTSHLVRIALVGATGGGK